jgi:hypothetical protein
MTRVFFLPLSVSLVVVVLDFFECVRYFQRAADTLWQRLLY